MSDLVPLFPRRGVPALRVDLVGGGQFDLASEGPANFTLLVFYQGLHCPICKMQLKDLGSRLDEFEKRGVSVLALSSDSQQRAEQTMHDADLNKPVGGVGLEPWLVQRSSSPSSAAAIDSLACAMKRSAFFFISRTSSSASRRKRSRSSFSPAPEGLATDTA